MATHSATHNRKAPHTPHGCAYVLWGDGFDEVMAVTFVTELRKAGIQVKLVGLRLQPMAGVYGVMLMPDVTLDEALAAVAKMGCLVVPCDEVGWQRLRSEPRICQLLAAVRESRIPLIFMLDAATSPSGEVWYATFTYVAIPPVDEGLTLQVQQIVEALKTSKGTFADMI